MKSSLLVLVLSWGAFAWPQTTTPSTQSSTTQQTPSSGSANQTTPSQATGAPGQLRPRGPEAVAQQDPNRVVATIEGKQITAQQALDMIKPVRAEDRQRFNGNLSLLVQQVYMQKQFADEAQKLSLDQQSPWKEQLQMARANILAQAYLSKLTTTSSTPAQDPKQYYDAHPEDFDEIKLSGIFVGFKAPGAAASANGVASRTEQEARQKANDLEQKIKSGGDVSALARSDSDDKRSAANGGELGTITSGNPNIPPDLKAAILKLQPGQVSEPIRVQNGFYILKAVSRTKIPFEQARTQIVQKWQNEKTQATLKQEFDKYKIQVQDPDFFNASNAAPAKIPSLQKPSGSSPASTPPRSSPAPSTPQAPH